MLKNIRKQVDKSLAEFITKAKHHHRFNLVAPILYDSIRDFVLREGKRIRPVLFVLSYKGYSRKKPRVSPSIYYVSTCVELLHNFMLIHDDIIDRSDLRRGKPTMHKMLTKAAATREPDKLGHDLSIVAGDIVYALAFDAFLSIQEDRKRKEDALKYFIQTAVLTAMGEFIDTLHGVQRLNKVTERDVFLNYALKTARYTFDCPLVVGAKLAGANRQDIRLLSQLGLAVGEAFQIQDDIIGVFDTQKNIGKSILSDIAESKKTILVCHADKTLTSHARKRFLKHFMRPKKTYRDLVALRRVFVDAGSLSYSVKQIRSRIERSNTIMRKLKMRDKHLKEIKKAFNMLFGSSLRIARQHGITFPEQPFL